MAIKGEFADGSPMMAIPNYARVNREKDLPPEAGPLAADPSFYMGPTARQPAAPEQGPRRGSLPLASVIWIRQG